MIDKMVKLYNGVEIPSIGFGTSDLNEGCETVVYNALKTGYKHIDTASQYANEEAVGCGINRAAQEMGLRRSDYFVTGKVANNERKGYQSTLEAYERSLNKLKLDYLDLYLIHWPVPWKAEESYKELNVATWEAMEYLYNTGKVRAIGVSNFLPRHIESMVSMCKAAESKEVIYPMVNQIEIHPQFQEIELTRYCQDNNIAVCAWGPFRQGKIFGIKLLEDIALKYNKTISQVIIRWNLQRNIMPLPKTTDTARMKQNLNVFDFELSEEDMNLIQSLDTDNCYFDNYSYARQMKY